MTKKLTIKQVKNILAISYPTALKFAKFHGEFNPSVPPTGLWLIDADVVRKQLESEIEIRKLSLAKIEEMAS